MCQSLGGFAMFISAPYLCTKVKIILVGCVLVIAATGYIILEVMLKTEKRNRKAESCEQRTEVTVERTECDKKGVI